MVKNSSPVARLAAKLTRSRRAEAECGHLPGQQRANYVPGPGFVPDQSGEVRGTNVPGFGFVPHPLDVNIRALHPAVLRGSDGYREIEIRVAACPDGCGLVAWTDTMLPFNAASIDEVRNWAEGPARNGGQGNR